MEKKYGSERMLKFLLLFVVYFVCYILGMFTAHVIHYFVKRREYKDNVDLLIVERKVIKSSCPFYKVGAKTAY